MCNVNGSIYGERKSNIADLIMGLVLPVTVGLRPYGLQISELQN